MTNRLLLPLLLCGALSTGNGSRAQAPAPPVTRTPLPDAPGQTVRVVAPPGLIAPPAKTRPLKIAIYIGAGAGVSNASLIRRAARTLEETQATLLSPQEFATRDLSAFDVVVFGGGQSSKQAAALGEAGKLAVKTFVREGGGFVGICAGAFLACANHPWSLAILDAKTRPSNWARGGGAVGLEMTDAGRKIFGSVRGQFPIRYNNGPILEPFGSPDLPDYEAVALFRDEIGRADSPVGLMKGSPAVVASTFGAGRVMAISPHPEGTRNLEAFVPRALAWAARDKK